MTHKAYVELPAVSGLQAGHPYYCVMCPLRMVSGLFTYTDNSLPPDMREQRTLNKQRIPEMKNYILSNRDSYVFSALTASVDGDMAFIPYRGSDNIGKLRIGADSRILINDGQHRRAAIEAALSECPELAFEDISIVIYYDLGLKKAQQMFSDLNKHAVRPTKSLNILYDNRDTFSLLIKDCIEKIPVFKGNVECEKSSISNRSSALFTLSGIYHATKLLISGSTELSNEAARQMVVDFWNAVCANMQPWIDAQQHIINPEQFRRDYLCAHAITLKAIGEVGKSLISSEPDRSNWESKLHFLSEINWKKENDDFQGMVITNGRISSSHNNQKALTEYLLKKSRMGDEGYND